MTQSEMADAILDLKEDKNAVNLAHNNEITEIQDIVDYVGSSLGLASQAAITDADNIVFCGVHLMAELAKRPMERMLAI